MRFTISLAQMHIQVGLLDHNMARAVEFIAQASRLSSSFLLLPELWPSGYDLPNAARYAQSAPEIMLELQRQAKLHQICLGGSLITASSDGLYNTFAWIDPTLAEPVFYRKIHLFRLMQEDQWLKVGQTSQKVLTPWGVAGLAVCYDLRFPELFRRYALEGATSVILAAEWPIRRINHWQTLLRARAIENQSFVFAANCVGPSAKDVFGGCSSVISPWGEILIEGDQTNEALLTTEIETDQIEQVRQFMPVFQDRQPDTY